MQGRWLNSFCLALASSSGGASHWVLLLGCAIQLALAPDPPPPVVPQAALDADYLQRALSHDLPLPLATWHGTREFHSDSHGRTPSFAGILSWRDHADNSFNVNNKTGLFFEKPHNQIYGIDAQLRFLGVRYVELDVRSSDPTIHALFANLVEALLCSSSCQSDR